MPEVTLPVWAGDSGSVPVKENWRAAWLTSLAVGALRLTVGRVRSTVQVALAAVPTLPARSTPRTEAVCTPSPRVGIDHGEVQVVQVLASREHSVRARPEEASVDANAIEAEVLLVTPVGAEEIWVAGAVRSTDHAKEASPTFSERSETWTANVCGPSTTV